MSSRKNRKNIAAAPVAPSADVTPDAPPVNVFAPDAASTAVAVNVAAVLAPGAPVNVNLDAPPSAPDATVATPRTRRTIGTIAAGDRADASPTRTLSLAARFAALHVDPVPLMFSGGFLNVTQPVMMTDAALLSPDAPGYVSLPYSRNRAALTLARDILTVAASDSYANASPLTRAAVVAFAHDRAMRATRTRDAGHFDSTGVSELDIRASLTRAACRLANLPTHGCGTRAALAATLPARLSEIDARLAALDAP